MSEMLNPKVTVVVVTYNSENEIIGCVDSINQSSEIEVEVIIIDNLSNDNTPSIVSEIADRCANVKTILNQENVGLAKANNQCLNISNGDYILILNPDTAIDKKAINSMANYLDKNNEVGVVGCQNIFEDGKPHTSFHSNWTIFHVLLWRLFPYGIVRNLYDNLSTYKEKDVMFVSGACLMIRKDLFVGIGGYDEKLFLTVEDAADLCIRVKNNGFRTVFYPEATVMHIGGRSGASSGSGFVVYHAFQGSIYFIGKYYGKFQASVLRVILICNLFAKSILFRFASLFNNSYVAKANKYLEIAKNVTSDSY